MRCGSVWTFLMKSVSSRPMNKVLNVELYKWGTNIKELDKHLITLIISLLQETITELQTQPIPNSKCSIFLYDSPRFSNILSQENQDALWSDKAAILRIQRQILQIKKSSTYFLWFRIVYIMLSWPTGSLVFTTSGIAIQCSSPYLSLISKHRPYRFSHFTDTRQ